MRNLLPVGKTTTSRSIARVTTLVAVTVGLLWLEGGFGAGRRTVIEFDPDVAADGSGDSWDFGDVQHLALADNLSSDAINLGFSVRIGSTDYTTIFIHENGIVTFGTPLAEDFTAAANLAALEAHANAPFIAPYYANLILPDAEITNGDASSVAYFPGTADPVEPYHPEDRLDGDPPDPVDERVPAFAVVWRDANFNPALATQLVLYSESTTGDFALRLRYGSPTDTPVVYDGLAGFSLHTGVAADVVTVANPLGGGDLVAPPTDLFYRFRGGHLVVATADADGDGVADTTDNCPADPNADQADADADGIGNVCDADRDGDGVANAVDNCPAVANANQADADQDGTGNVCDPDIDGDNVANATDNCPLIANANQRNLDGDALGDACDADLDGDLVANTVDNCPLVANPSQADSNSNGIGDACDTAPLRCRVDSDSDVDALDILAILKAIPKPASGPTDPRDADGNGKISLLDAAKCTQQCTRRSCLP